MSSTGNTATSALNQLVNDFIFYYEKGLRANKVGIPAGVFSGAPLSDRVEGLYSEVHSRQLLLAALDGVDDFYNGIGYNGAPSGLSLADYINERSGNTELSNDINARLNTARQAILDNLDANLSDQVVTDNSQMLAVYDELQKVVPLIKVDMLQVLNINVDFVDADGD